MAAIVASICTVALFGADLVVGTYQPDILQNQYAPDQNIEFKGRNYTVIPNYYRSHTFEEGYYEASYTITVTVKSDITIMETVE